MKTLIIGGTAPRHLYYINAVANHPAVEVTGIILQHRTDGMPNPPSDLDPHDHALWRRHFEARQAAEAAYFPGQRYPAGAQIVSYTDLNERQTARAARLANADLVLIFGCGMIRDPLMAELPENKINLHLGLSPRYRGAATLFWPQYFLEPNHAGATFHRITDEPDAGDILHQSRPALLPGDTIHDVACRTVLAATSDALELLSVWPDWQFKRQRNTGKCFLERDFQAQHLRTIYDTWNDQVVDAYLEGYIQPDEPLIYEDNLTREGVAK